MADIIKGPRGVNDVLPFESYKWQYIENIARIIAQNYNIREVRVPMFEHTELFHRGVGDTTDVVQKEMYTFLDKGNRSITLRPEGTASTVRLCLEHSLLNGTLPLKTYYIVPNFRYEKPEAGRLREHHQFGVEYFGTADSSADAEVISIADTLLKTLGILNAEVSINSIGCPKCRPTFHENLKKYFEDKKEHLCELCLDRLDKNPMRIIDCKNEKCSEIAKNAPTSIDNLCEECHSHFEGTKKHLETLEIPFKVDTGIVRGLDYYTKTVFEFVSKDTGLTICGGGRYDGLVETLGGKPTPALGFGCGIERLIMMIEANGQNFGLEPQVDIFIANIGDEANLYATKLTHNLRIAGFSAEKDIAGRALKVQMKYADKIGAKYSTVIGDGELESKLCTIKNMENGEKTEVNLDEIADFIVSDM
ncbi:MAG: histidine--tRNA ligase [Clostridia bacterium]